MKNKFIPFIILISLLFSQHLIGQNNTNSPFTRFGFGDITQTTPTELRGMGGVSLANRTPLTINPMNPASYSSVDSMTFMFDVAATLKSSRFSDTQNSSSSLNANLDYLTLRMPFTKWLGFSAGVLPYSSVGYSFLLSDTVSIPTTSPTKVNYNQSFVGTGGFSQVYGGLSVKLWNKISLGTNLYYVFGKVQNLRSLSFAKTNGFTSTLYTNQIKATDLRLRYGIQVEHIFARKHKVNFGAIYESKSTLDGEYSATLNNKLLHTNTAFELPEFIGAGLSYTYNDRFTVGADYTLQKWADVKFFGKTDSLVNQTTLKLGAEYVANPTGRSFKDRVRYRVGFNTSNPYYKIGGKTVVNNFNISFGIGIPLRTSRTMLNTTIEYGKVGANDLLREDYLKITFSTSLNELWFFKRKL